MKMAAHAFLVVAFGFTSLSFGGEDEALVEIALYPYDHDPASAWKLTILVDGTIRYAKSAEPVKLPVVSTDDGIQWVPRSRNAPKRPSSAKQRKRIEQLRTLQLGSHRSYYSAEHSYVDSTTETLVVQESRKAYTTAAEVRRVVTHAATCCVRVSLEDTSVDSLVYAPFSALDGKDPEDPDPAAIPRILSAWYYVLRVVGSVNNLKARNFRVGRE
jgi:hypothetical protein